jgi:2-dehydropantoate 2-reductase
MMKIVIMGAGAMGSLFGGLLASSGEEVWLVDPRRAQIEAIRSAGLTIEKEGRALVIRVNATEDVLSAGKAGLVIIFVKAPDTERAVSDALALEDHKTVFLSLQNGLGNEDVICARIDRRKVMLGVTGHGATVLGPGRIRHAGTGKTTIGALDDTNRERAIQVAALFRKARIETEVSGDIHELIWDKLMVNVGINALTALTNMKNGQLLEHPETLALMEGLIFEGAEVARKKGIRITPNPFERAKQVAYATRDNRSSMGQDFDFKRKTEIDVINGAVVREAKRLGIAAPCNETITNLVKVIEKHF